MNTKKTEDYEIMLDAPRQAIQASNKLNIKGWIVVFSKTIVGIRINKDKKFHNVEFAIRRDDVAKARPQYQEQNALFSGFETVYEFDEDGDYIVEVDFGEGFVSVIDFELVTNEPLYRHYFDPAIAENIAEHKTIIGAKKKYFHRTSTDKNYVHSENDARLVAFYLPQYHPISQNDEAWGKGFTEWTNVAQGTPRFVGHEQPVLPSDLGFYDLRNEFVIKDQIDLAKKYGIYAFCFYYYWFSGEKILDAPINSLLKHKEWDFNFMICWANENWTKRWDGQDNEVIISQKYKDDDPIAFIKEVEPILLDKRYLREDGKPLLAVYRGSELKKPKKYIEIWREYFREKHNLELHIVSMMNFDAVDPRKQGFDAGVEFAPLTMYKKPEFDKKRAEVKNFRESFIDPNYIGNAIDYRALLPVLNNYKDFDFPTYKSVSPSWDNDARKKGKQSGVFFAANTDNYGKWLAETIKRVYDETQKPLIFINAWNEWGEGAVLEPTINYGHANLLRTAEVLAEYGNSPKNKLNFPLYGMKRSLKTSDTAVIVHVYYEQEWLEISKKLLNAQFSHDLFITLPSKANHLRSVIKKHHPLATIIDVPNRGRDILPFVFIANKLKELKYKYILKLHTKRTVHRSDGSDWLGSIVDSLVHDKQTVTKITEHLESGTALVGPAGHYVSLWENTTDINDRKLIFDYLGDRKDLRNEIDLKQNYAFFAGTMFWCRVDALDTVTSWMLCPEDFESERGQHDGTLAHALERMFTVIPQLESKLIAEVDGKTIRKLSRDDGEKVYRFNQASNRVDDSTNLPSHMAVLDYKNEIARLKKRQLYKNQQLDLIKNKYEEVITSKSYRTGRLLLASPRSMKRHYHTLRHKLGIVKNDYVQKKQIYNTYGLDSDRDNSKLRVDIYVRSYFHPTSSTFIRLISPFSDTWLKGISTVKLRDGERLRFYNKTDVIIVQRTAIAYLDDAKRLVKHAHDNNIKLFVDTDDAFGELDRGHHQYELQKERVDALDYIIQNANQVWFSTEKLQELYPGARSKVVRNSLDSKIWSKLKTKNIIPPPINSPLRVVYMGTVTHNQDFEMIVPALDKLHREMPGEFILYVIGVSARLSEKPWIEVLKPKSALYPEFVQWFNELDQFDIGLSPLVDDSFNQNKSDVKCLDYLANGIKPIVSDVEAYSNNQLDKYIVRVQNSTDAWYKAVKKEIKGRTKSRTEMQKQARKGFDYIMEYRSTTTTAEQIEKAIIGTIDE